jgi:hypothetical protein
MSYLLKEPLWLSKQEQLFILENALIRIKRRHQEYCCLAIIEAHSGAISIHSNVKFIIPSFKIEKAVEICRLKKIRKPKLFCDDSWWDSYDERTFGIRVRFMSAFIEDFKKNM